MRNRVLGVLAALAVVACGEGSVVAPETMTKVPDAGVLAIGVDQATGATIETDKDDYLPGEVVHLTGSGWAPGETVHLFMTETPDTHGDVSMDVVADGAGAFSLHFYDVVDHDAGVVFTLVGTGASSGSRVAVVFTDAVPINSVTLDGATSVTVAPSTSIATVVAGNVNIGSGLNTLGSIELLAYLDGSSPSTAVSIACHDVSPNVVQSGPGNTSYSQSFSVTAPASSGTYDVIARAHSNDSCTSEVSSFTLNNGIVVQAATNNPPTVLVAALDATGNEGSTLTTSGSFKDDDGDAITITKTSGVGTVTDNGDGTWSWSYPTTDNGSGSVTVTASSTGGTVSDTFDWSASNVAPTATFGNNGPVDEGSPILLALTNPYDPSTDDVSAGLQYAFDCGNGSGYGAYSATSSTSCATSDNGTRSVKGKVKDKDGGETEYTASVTVNNVAPVVNSIAASSYGPMPVTAVVTISGTFTDPGTSDTHTLALTCDGGVASATSATQPNYSGTCTFTAAGVYLVSATITDDDGGSGSRTETQYIVVYDPSAGFVTGGGWINSPLGAYAADASLTGRATFGFVSKYQKGATTPTGSTEFQFHAGALNFKSTSYQWLVVSGAQAQYKGDGTVNGVAGYGFILSAWDGQQTGGDGVDKFRIKITDAGGNVVYDNQMGGAVDAVPNTALGGGSIVIHTGGKSK